MTHLHHRMQENLRLRNFSERTVRRDTKVVAKLARAVVAYCPLSMAFHESCTLRAQKNSRPI